MKIEDAIRVAERIRSNSEYMPWCRGVCKNSVDDPTHLKSQRLISSLAATFFLAGGPQHRKAARCEGCETQRDGAHRRSGEAQCGGFVQRLDSQGMVASEALSGKTMKSA